MLGLFSAKSDHPLADAKEMRRLLDLLPSQEPAAALDETMVWLESLSTAEDMKLEQRLDLMLRLDEATLPHARRLVRDYLSSQNLSRSQELRLWRCNYDYWAQLAAAYETCFNRYASGEKSAKGIEASLALLLARLMFAYAACLKWTRFRYAMIDSKLWLGAGRVYLAASTAKLEQKRLPIYANSTASSVEQEYLQALALHSSSVNNLLPLEMEIAERLIAYLLPQLIFTSQSRPDSVYWIDAASSLPPRRLITPPAAATTLRFISPGKALEVLADIRARIEESGAVPADVQLGGQYSPSVVLPVLDHLALNWMPKPPMRSHSRHHVKSRLSVINGLAAIHARLVVGNDPWNDSAEAWIAEDVSIGGMGAQISPGANDWVRIGALVGVQPEGGDNWLIGVVRRFHRGSEGAPGSVGIQTIGKAPRAIVADSDGLETEAILLDALSLDDAAERVEMVDVVLPSTAYENGVPLTFELDGKSVRLQAHALVESGVDYSIGRYRVE